MFCHKKAYFHSDVIHTDTAYARIDIWVMKCTWCDSWTMITEDWRCQNTTLTLVPGQTIPLIALVMIFVGAMWWYDEAEGLTPYIRSYFWCLAFADEVSNKSGKLIALCKSHSFHTKTFSQHTFIATLCCSSRAKLKKKGKCLKSNMSYLIFSHYLDLFTHYSHLHCVWYLMLFCDADAVLCIILTLWLAPAICKWEENTGISHRHTDVV